MFKSTLTQSVNANKTSRIRTILGVDDGIINLLNAASEHCLHLARDILCVDLERSHTGQDSCLNITSLLVHCCESDKRIDAGLSAGNQAR